MNNRTDLVSQHNILEYVPYLYENNKYCSCCGQLLPEDKRQEQKTHIAIRIAARDRRYKNIDCITY